MHVRSSTIFVENIQRYFVGFSRDFFRPSIPYNLLNETNNTRYISAGVFFFFGIRKSCQNREINCLSILAKFDYSFTYLVLLVGTYMISLRRPSQNAAPGYGPFDPWVNTIHSSLLRIYSSAARHHHDQTSGTWT